MQQKDDVWSRECLVCVNWVPVGHVPPTDTTDSFRAPKKLKSPAWSHIHPNNTDSQHSLPAACSALAMVHEVGAAIFPSTAANQGVPTHFSWHSVGEGDVVSIHHWLLPPFLLRADWEIATARLLSMGPRPPWGLLDRTRSETNERIKIQSQSLQLPPPASSFLIPLTLGFWSNNSSSRISVNRLILQNSCYPWKIFPEQPEVATWVERKWENVTFTQRPRLIAELDPLILSELHRSLNRLPLLGTLKYYQTDTKTIITSSRVQIVLRNYPMPLHTLCWPPTLPK